MGNNLSSLSQDSDPHQVVSGETQTHGAEGVVREIEEVEALRRKVLIETHILFVRKVAKSVETQNSIIYYLKMSMWL